LNFQDFIGLDRTSPNFIEPEKKTEIIKPSNFTPQNNQETDLAPEYFDLDKFVKELYQKTSTKNKENMMKQKYMSSYDVASSCISNIINHINLLNFSRASSTFPSAFMIITAGASAITEYAARRDLFMSSCSFSASLL